MQQTVSAVLFFAGKSNFERFNQNLFQFGAPTLFDEDQIDIVNPCFIINLS